MPTINPFSASSVSDYLPNKVIPGSATTLVPLESWMYDDGTGDPWWQGAAGVPCRWQLVCTVSVQQHSSHLTRLPFFYTGLDIVPGMWVFSTGSAAALRVVAVESASDSEVTLVVEDVDRYNTFRNPSGSGDGSFPVPNDVVFFQLGDDGLPIIDPLPGSVLDLGIVSQVEARFRVFNSTVKQKFFQLNHGFKEGNMLTLNPSTGLFEHATSNDIYLVGTVVAVGPGPNQFYLSPSTKIIKDLEPGLPGSKGDVVWLQTSTGALTTTPTGSNVPVYIQMTNPTPSYTIGAVIDATTFSGTKAKINGLVVEFTGTDPIPASEIVNSINTYTEQHGVVASISASATVVVGTAVAPTASPVGPDYMQFSINGVATNIAPPSINYGTTGDIGWWDVVRAVNEQTYMHGVTATMDLINGFISLTHKAGGSIAISNISPSVTSGANKTFTDFIGVPTFTAPGTANRLKLTRSDGGSILLQNGDVGDFIANTGLSSSANGELPLALVVDKSMSASKSFVVATDTDRDQIPNIRSGDQVFVQASQDGEWALFVRTENSWTKIADYDSASTDAATISSEIAFDTVTPVVIGNISSGSRVVNVTIKVTSAFNSVDAVVSVGTGDNPTAIIGTQASDLTQVGSYEISTSYTYTGVDDGEIVVYLNADGSTVGAATVLVSYL